MEQKWFWGVTNSKQAFLDYIESEYTFNKLISINPVELKDIALEMMFYANKLNVTLPDYIKSMSENPVGFSELALDQGIEPDYSEVTKLNEEQGTNFKNMVEYFKSIRHLVPKVSMAEPRDPLVVMANTENDGTVDINDDDQYLKSLLV